MPLSGISIVVCCYNSSNRIRPTLEHIAKQKTNRNLNWEVILVDNASKDDTSDKACSVWKEQKTTQELNIIQESIPGLMNARKKGFAESKYDIILFVDDDNWLSESYVQTAYNIMKSDEQIGVLGGVGSPVFDGAEKPKWFDKFEGAYAVGKQAKSSGDVTHSKRYVYGAGITVRKKGWEYIFNNDFHSLLLGRTGDQLTSGEEVEMCYAFIYSGYKIWYDERLQFKHQIPDGRCNWGFIRKNYKGFGLTMHVIHAYKYYANHDERPQDKLKLPLWLDLLLYNIKLLNQKRYALYRYLTGTDKDYVPAANAIIYWEEFKSLLKLRAEIHQLYDDVGLLKKRLSKSN